MNLIHVEAALELPRERRYGLCRDRGDFIGLPRLRSLPFAQRCRPCQERMEQAEPRRTLAAVAVAEPE